MSSTVCDLCDESPAQKKVESILVRVYFQACRSCIENYAEPKPVIKDFIQSRDSLPEWFDDVTYYHKQSYKPATNLV
jgi:hypothetical protein